MKKTILATLVSVVAIGATASEVKIDTPELYGKVGVSYDNVQQKEFATQNELNITRNTEAGLRGALETSVPFGVKYDVRISAEEDKDGYHFDLSRANVTFEHELFYVTTGLAESSYDNATSAMDVFDSHFISKFEVFDAVDAEEMITIGATPVAGLDVALDVAGQGLGETIALSAKYSVSGFDLGAAYEATDVEKGKSEKDKPAQDSHAYKFGAGYDFANVGVNGLYAGVVYEFSTDDMHGGEDVKNDAKTISFTTAYQINDAVTLSAGYANVDNSRQSVEGAAMTRFAVDYAAADNVVVKAGYANLSIDNASDDDMFTVGMTYSF